MFLTGDELGEHSISSYHAVFRILHKTTFLASCPEVANISLS